MDRRAFLRLLGAAGVGSTLNRKYFFAPGAGWLPSQTWQRFTITLPKPGIYTADIDYGCKWELADCSYYVMAAHPVKDIENIWLSRTRAYSPGNLTRPVTRNRSMT
jgi:hypothetical protein